MKRAARARDAAFPWFTWRITSVYVNGKAVPIRDSKRHRDRVERQAATRGRYSGNPGPSQSRGAWPRAFED